MIGHTVSHYKILEKLGEGGMGVVYRAEDLKLKRIVALKFLPQHLTRTEAEQTRLQQEAQAAATLNHPNICTIHAISEHEGQQFIDMELVDGKTLREKLSAGHLSVPDAIAYAIQIGEALYEAHAKGIVHRDVKAENIMVNTKNQIKVMDFGLAKLKGSLKLTKTSSTVGTLAYMAPEQIQGGEVDARSDIFAFGVLLFEMLTGKLPFRGDHESAMMYSIVNEEPEPVQKYLPDASPELMHILNKALDKDPDSRYQSAADMVVDLRRVRKESGRVSRAAIPVGSAADLSQQPPPVATMPTARRWRFTRPRIITTFVLLLLVVAAAIMWLRRPSTTSADRGERKSLAVLPFENQGDPEKEYFSDGLTDEITSRLSRLSGLAVIARSSAKQYKKSAKSLAQIGEELGVQYVLMGTVRWSGSSPGDLRVRVNPELIRVNGTFQIWSEPVEVRFSDAFGIQSDIASEVARALDVNLLQPEKQALVEKSTQNAAAYDYYLRGLAYDDKGVSRGDIELAMRMYEQAISADPGFAAAYAKLSRDHSSMYWFFYDRSEARLVKAKEAGDKALALSPNLSDAYAAKGWYYYHGLLDYDRALEQFDLALKYQPNNPDVYFGIASVQRRQGKMREAIESYQKSVEADPRSSENSRQLGETYTLARDYQNAEIFCDRAIKLSPDNEYAHIDKLANILQWTGDLQRARGAIDEAIEQHVSDQSPELLKMRLRIEILSGSYERASQMLDETPSFQGIDDQFQVIPRSLIYAHLESFLGDRGKATSYYNDARVLLERKTQSQPGDERYHSALGIAYAGLGRKEEAVREAQRGVDLLPVEKEAWRGAYRLTALAQVYVMVGELEKAIEVLERLVTIPSNVSGQILKLDPVWKPLHGNKRFQAMIQ